MMASSPLVAGERYVHQGANLRTPGSQEALSAARPGEARDIAKTFVTERVTDLGLVSSDVDELVVSSESLSRSSGVRHVYLQQHLAGIPVLGATLNLNIASDGRVLSVGNRLMPELASSANGAAPSIRPVDAAGSAVAHLDLGVEPAFSARSSKRDARRHTVLNDGGIAAGDVPVELVWYPRSENDVRLAWHVALEITETSNWWQIYVDAHTGEVLGKDDLVVHDTFGDPPARPRSSRLNQAAPPKADDTPAISSNAYEVFAMPAEYPYENNDPSNPADDVPAADADGGRTIVADPFDLTASPFGWHDTDGVAGPEFTTPQGNNVHAYIDADANNVPDAGEPDGGPGLVFTGAVVPLDLINDSPPAYRPAAAVNLFYWNNIIHDVFYHYGFDEVSGNFQENNYGNGGAGSDYVFAEAQDGSGTNNANFATPADGANPRMQMFTWTTTTPNRDGDFSSGIIIHEYGHGISNRLTGGPADANCLFNSEQMGEGWSDWLGMVLTANAGDTRTTVRGLGTYALGEDPATGGGIRPAPYTTDMGTNGFTYGDTAGGGLSVPHGIGFVWATALWEVYWDLVDEYGFNDDFYQDWTTGGNNLAIQLVMDGMKLQPCSPGFVDGRDAIIQADANLTGGANECLLWKAFARRGLGESAAQGSSGSNGDNVGAFDFPVSCDFLGATPETVAVCAGNDGVYDITVGGAFQTPVNLSTTSDPAGTSTSFDPNPLMTVPGSTELTVSNTGGLSAGTYNFNVRGDDTVTQFDLAVALEVFDQTPGAVNLTAPADGAMDQTVNPTLSWSAAAGGGTYNVQVATDAGFSNVVDSATGLTTNTYTVQIGLDTATTFYWRVQAVNPCGTESYTAAFSFTTAVAPGDCPIGIAATVGYSEDFEAGAAGWTTPAGVGANTWASASDRVRSGVSSYHADDPGSISDQYLVSPSIAVPSGGSPATMRFWTYQEIEDGGAGCYDAGVLEISTDGTTWTRLESEILVTPYDGTVDSGFSNPIGGDNGWCGDPRDWTRTVVNIDAWAGQNVQFRFRMTSDSSVSHPGWWIDDVSVQSCTSATIFEDGFEAGNTLAWSTTSP